MSYHRLAELKFNQFKEDIKDEISFEKKLNYLIKNEFDATLSDILQLEPDTFIGRIDKGISFTLENIYTEECLSDPKLTSIIEKLINNKKSEYSTIIQLLKDTWNTYEKLLKRRPHQDSLLSNYRKHCFNSDNFAHHNCGSTNSNFLIVKNRQNKIKFVICESCKKVYYSSYISCRCNFCNVDYYSGILTEEENPNFLVATWEKYHCAQIINEKMKCIKCRELFYLDMKNGTLACLNKRCGFITKPSRILWTCSFCQEEFKSDAIPYNPLYIQVVKKAIRQTLLLKHRAHPNKMPCCKLNVFFTEFFHKKTCKGILYEGELNDNMIVVCEKCQAINFYDRFIWTCPQCLRKFRDIKNNDDFEQNININNNINININKYEDKKFKSIDDIDNNNSHNNNFHSNRLIKKKEKCRSVCKDEVNNRYKDRYYQRFKGREKSNEINKENNINNVIVEDKERAFINNFETKKEVKRYDLKLKYESPVKRNNYYRNNNYSNFVNSRMESQKDRCFKIILKNESVECNSDNKNNKIQNNINVYNNNLFIKSSNNLNNKYDIQKNIISGRVKEFKLESANNNKKEEKKESKEENHTQSVMIRSNTTNDKVQRDSKRYCFYNRFKDLKDEKKNNEKKDINLQKIIKDNSNDNSPKKEGEYRKDRYLRRNISVGNLSGRKKEEIEQKNFINNKNNNIVKDKSNNYINNNNYNNKINNNYNDKSNNDCNSKINRRLYESPKRENKKVRYASVEYNKSNDNKEEKRRNEQNLNHFQKNNILPYNRKLTGNIEDMGNYRKNKIRFHAYLSQSKEINQKENIEEKKQENNENRKYKKFKRFLQNKDEENKENNNNEDKNEEEKEQENKNTTDNSNPKSKENEERRNFRRNIINNKDNKEQNKGKILEFEEKENNNKNINIVRVNKENDADISSIPENIGLQNLVGLTDKLLLHLKRRINNIFLKTKIPIFNIEDYKIERKLGEGSYGIIYSVCKQNQKTPVYALKKIIARTVTEVCNFIKEFELVYSCNHQNIMKIFGLCLRILDSTTFAIYVLMEKSKYDWDKEIKLHLSKRKIYSEKELINILKQLTEALLFLKNNFNISHRDIKPQNILIFDDGKYKLADFGEAKEIKISKKLNTLRGTELYMSPALYEGLKQDKNDVSHNTFKSDVFSLGFCLLFAAGLNYNLLYKVRDITDNNITEREINNHLQKMYSNTFIQILSKMLKVDEIQRFGFTEILEYIDKNYA